MGVYLPSVQPSVPATLTAPTPSTIPLTINSASGQTGNLLVVNGTISTLAVGHDGTLVWGSVQSNLDPYGNMVVQSGGGVYCRGTVVQFNALPAFAAGDHYVTVDSSGNLHKSAIGPAS